jgi:hypothetical protein
MEMHSTHGKASVPVKVLQDEGTSAEFLVLYEALAVSANPIQLTFN